MRCVTRLVRFMCVVLLLCCGVTHAADDPADAILGNWLTEPQDGIIAITRNADGSYQGRIVGGNAPGKLDSNNPDAARRTQPLRGQLIMQGLRYDGQRDGAAKWSSGTIYDPASGNSYRCKLELRSDGALKVRGYIGIALIGKSQRWTRYTGTSMDLPK